MPMVSGADPSSTSTMATIPSPWAAGLPGGRKVPPNGLRGGEVEHDDAHVALGMPGTPSGRLVSIAGRGLLQREARLRGRMRTVDLASQSYALGDVPYDASFGPLGVTTVPWALGVSALAAMTCEGISRRCLGLRRCTRLVRRHPRARQHRRRRCRGRSPVHNRHPRRRRAAPRRARDRQPRRPCTTMRYDRARVSLNRHATYIVATFLARASR
jgi:hypothetical protein